MRTGYIHGVFRVVLIATSMVLYPPYEQQILHYLVFETVLPSRILQELERVLYPLWFIIGRGAFTKG